MHEYALQYTTSLIGGLWEELCAVPAVHECL